MYVIGLLLVCFGTKESEHRKGRLRRYFYLPPWHRTDMLLCTCIITLRIVFYLPFISGLCVIILGTTDVTSSLDRRIWGSSRCSKLARCISALGDRDSPTRVSPRNRSMSVRKETLYNILISKHYVSTFKLPVGRKHLVKFCIYFGIMTSLYSLRWETILWFFVVRWKERYFKNSLLQRVLYAHKTIDTNVGPYSRIWTSRKVGNYSGKTRTKTKSIWRSVCYNSVD